MQTKLGGIVSVNLNLGVGESGEIRKKATKGTSGSILGFLIQPILSATQPPNRYPVAYFSVQILFDRPFCVNAGLIRIQAHHALS
jgi:hypothetical protein